MQINIVNKRINQAQWDIGVTKSGTQKKHTRTKERVARKKFSSEIFNQLCITNRFIQKFLLYLSSN